ncbi:MAG: GTPase HflX [Ruminococcus sp.]|jgi:GTP-binding protein HflX|nr:GTPase HflX [Ruminococcus sp.]
MTENIKKETQKVILVLADTGEYDAESSLKELTELAKTAGAEVIGQCVQKKQNIDSATYIGSGRLIELGEQAESLEADFVIFDTDLTAVQMKNIEKVVKCKIIDRTTLILDIFAANARTAEGRIQVELAQLKYSLPRLQGKGLEMSRIGGGSAGGLSNRGAGETKLEYDRRHIRRRIHTLTEELEELKKRREATRSRRKKDSVLSAAIVGYTNVGKSTLLNALTDAGVLAENKLFATLDTTARSIELPDGRSVLLIDTVGLLRRLPHHLVEAFKSTLEEAASCDLLINIIDLSSPEGYEQARVTESLLAELGCGEIPQINVLNKCDKVSDINDIRLDSKTVMISAKKGFGIEKLLECISQNLPATTLRRKFLIPFKEAAITAQIRENGKIFSEDFTEDGIEIDCLIDVKFYAKIDKYRTEDKI